MDDVVSAAVVHALARRLGATGENTVLIDGPSGAGKSTFAAALVDRLRSGHRSASAPAPRLVAMDSIYRGWAGLDDAACRVGPEILLPHSRGVTGRFRRWNWASATRGAVVDVPAGGILVLEGCGALDRRNIGFSSLRIWIDADDVVRRDRALRRDGAVFETHWDEWDEQFSRYVMLNRPAESATVRLTTTRSR